MVLRAERCGLRALRRILTTEAQLSTFVARGTTLPSLALLLAVITQPLAAQRPLPVRDDSIRVRTPRPSPDSTGGSATSGGSPNAGGGFTSLGRPTPGGTSNTADPVRGRYRVVLNGITVNRQTYDHFLQIDGKGDEVYFATYVATFDTATSDVVSHDVVTSKVHGDINGFPERKLVGMASGRGGIVTGDKYPFPTPFRRRGEPTTDELPMLLWEGELVQGQSAVVIAPTIWEWDDNPQLYAHWVVGRGALIQQLLEPEPLHAIINNRSWLPVDLGAPGLRVITNFIGDPRDRPIGLDAGQPATDARFAEVTPNAHGATAPGGTISADVWQILGGLGTPVAAPYDAVFRQLMGANRPANTKAGVKAGRVKLPKPVNTGTAVSLLKARAPALARRPFALRLLEGVLSAAARTLGAQQLFFFEKTIVLSPAAIEDALRSLPAKGGRPEGVIDMVYLDHSRLEGRYVLHVQVERLP